MTQEFLNDNIAFLKNSNVIIFNEIINDANVQHYISNSLADLGYRLSAEDIIFTFNRETDVRLVVKEEAKEKIKEEDRAPEPEEQEKDSTGQIDTERIGILTKDNTFYEYTIFLEGATRGYIHLVDITKVALKSIQPGYSNYDQKVNPYERKYKELDKLSLKFKDENEKIELRGHMTRSNKSLQEISRELFKRL